MVYTYKRNRETTCKNGFIYAENISLTKLIEVPF